MQQVAWTHLEAFQSNFVSKNNKERRLSRVLLADAWKGVMNWTEGVSDLELPQFGHAFFFCGGGGDVDVLL